MFGDEKPARESGGVPPSANDDAVASAPASEPEPAPVVTVGVDPEIEADAAELAELLREIGEARDDGTEVSFMAADEYRKGRRA